MPTPRAGHLAGRPVRLPLLRLTHRPAGPWSAAGIASTEAQKAASSDADARAAAGSDVPGGEGAGPGDLLAFRRPDRRRPHGRETQGNPAATASRRKLLPPFVAHGDHQQAPGQVEGALPRRPARPARARPSASPGGTAGYPPGRQTPRPPPTRTAHSPRCGAAPPARRRSSRTRTAGPALTARPVARPVPARGDHPARGLEKPLMVSGTPARTTANVVWARSSRARRR